MPKGIYSRGTGSPSCHPDRPYCARGLCKPCYDAAYKSEHKDAIKWDQHDRYIRTKKQLIDYYGSEADRAEAKLKALALHAPNGEVRCSWPGCDVVDPDMLVLDHIYDDGRNRRNNGELRGNGLYRKASKVKDPTLQTLCANHNQKKELMRRRAA